MFTAIEVDLKTALVRPARAGDDHVFALNVDGFVTEETGRDDLWSEHPADQFVSFRALHSKWRDVGLKDLDVQAPSDGVIFMHNWYNNALSGGIVGFANVTSGDGVDLGPPEPRFNDHDGSRNDIGKNGGHAYDSNGTTASRPVILSAQLAPMTIQQGVIGTVKIKTRAAVSTPRQ